LNSARSSEESPLKSEPAAKKMAYTVEMYSPLEQTALLLACVCHDLRHDGRTNHFHIVTSSPLAQLYNDQSPLENLHAYSAMGLLRKHRLLSGLSRSTQQELRSLIIRCILSTDLSKHVDILARFNEIAPSFDREDKEHRARSLELLIKCADVSNVLRPLPLAKTWADGIQEEMFAQGDVERATGLTISGFGDRERPQSAQLGVTFAEFMCAPLFQTISRALPKMEMYLSNISVTRNYWAAVIEADEEGDASEGDTPEQPPAN
jgi:hypothetical protein